MFWSLGYNNNISWNSFALFSAKQRIYNVWAKELFIFNTKNPIRLSIYIRDITAKAWKFYYTDYEIILDIAKQNIAKQNIK